MIRRINNWCKKTDKFDLIGYILLLSFSVYMLSYLYSNAKLLTDADQSSNLIYAKLLLEEGNLVSKNWFFSTYVDIVNMDKIQLLFFLFTDNWILVHWLTNVTIEIVLFISFYYACKQLEIKHIPWLAFLIIGSLNYQYYHFAFSFNIYALYMIYGLVSFGLLINLIKSKKPGILYLLFLFSVFLPSTSGIRNITTIYAPFIAMVVILFFLNKIGFYIIDDAILRKLKIILILTVLGSVFGYLFYKFFLCVNVGYQSTPLGITRDMIKEFPSIFRNVFLGWIGLYGIDSFSIISIFFSVLIFALVLWCIFTIKKKNENDLTHQIVIIVFLMSGLAISATFFISSSFRFEIRYLIQSFAFSVLVLGCMLSKISYKNAKVLLVLITLFVIVRTYEYKETEIHSSTNQELVEISNAINLTFAQWELLGINFELFTRFYHKAQLKQLFS